VANVVLRVKFGVKLLPGDCVYAKNGELCLATFSAMESIIEEDNLDCFYYVTMDGKYQEMKVIRDDNV
jgi:hypothetical protein